MITTQDNNSTFIISNSQKAERFLQQDNQPFIDTMVKYHKHLRRYSQDNINDDNNIKIMSTTTT